MCDIRIVTDFRYNRKRQKLEYLLGKEAVVCLIDLWLDAAEHRPDGVLTGYDALDLEIVSGWTGAVGAFADALVDVEFLYLTDDGWFKFKNWEARQPWASSRESRANKARFSVMARRHPGVHAALKAQGMTEITRAEYVKYAYPKGAANRVNTYARTNGLRPVYSNLQSPLSKGEGILPPLPPQGGSAQGEKPKPKRKVFQKPSRDEVAAFAAELGSTVGADEFCDHYDSNGWKVGRNAMKDWKATFRNWDRKRRKGVKSREKPSFDDLLDDAIGKLERGEEL